MSELGVRMLHRGVGKPLGGQRLAIFLVLVMMAPLLQPVNAEVGVGRDDFGVLEAMADALENQRDSGEDAVAQSSAEAILAALESRGRLIDDGDALLATDGVLGDISMRDTAPLEPDHPRPYQFLTAPDTHPDNWPNDLIETLFSLPTLSDPLAIGANTYSLYVNYSARDNGPQYEAWTYGTFTGDVLSLNDAGLFENAIDLDGDGADDVAVGLSLLGLGDQGEGWDIIMTDDFIPLVEGLWIRPNFQWKVRVLDYSNPMWDDLAHMEVSLMKGFAYDLSLTSDDGESYALVIDSKFTQPPDDFQVRVGLDKMEFAFASTFVASLANVLSLFTGGDESVLEVLSVSAPYSILISNPNRDSSNRQTDCTDLTYYDPIADYGVKSREHKCGYSIGIGYVHFDSKDANTGERPVSEIAYVDIGLHPEYNSTLIPEQADLVLRNDNTGDNSFDTIEVYSDVNSDLWFHYFEDRSKHIEPGGRLGNITDSRGWIHGLPSGSLPVEEINAIFTMMGEAPGSLNLPGDMPNRLSLIVGIKNFTADNSNNSDDPSLIMNPTNSRWNSLILIAGTERIDSIEYVSTFQRHGYFEDSSSLEVQIIDLPEVIVILGTFSIPESGELRVEYGTAPDLLSQLLDNIVLNIVEIVLDIGAILNGLPEAIVGTASESSGEIIVQCYNQVKSVWADGSNREVRTAGKIAGAIASSNQPVIIDGDHILLAEDIDNQIVDGRYGPEDPLVPVGMSLALTNVSGVGYSYVQETGTRTISLNGLSNEALVMGHLNHIANSTDGEVKQFATISNRPLNLTITQIDSIINYQASGDIGTITYSGEGDGQYNALRLTDLPSQFTLELGDTLGFYASEGVGAVEVQISNATEPLTMNGDHLRFWVDENNAEASMSFKISNITRVNLFPPDEPGASGPTGNSRFEMERIGSSPFSVLLEDQSIREDEFLGMTGRAHFEPLPANITFSLPSSKKSTIIKIPEFGQANGVLSLSFFLGGMIEFGSSINEFALESMVNLGDASNERSNITLGIDLITNEEFDLVLDIRKGVNTQEQPKWVHGISGEVFDATQMVFNYSRLPNFPESSRVIIAQIMEDWKINGTEREEFIKNLEWGGLSNTEAMTDAMSDGYLSVRERSQLDLEDLAQQGLEMNQRRSWHLKMWMPNLPAGQIKLNYELVVNDAIPTFQITGLLQNYQPERPMLSILLKGLNRVDTSLIIEGLNTEIHRDVEIDLVMTTESDLVIPRTKIEMVYQMGERFETAHLIQNNHQRGIRTELMMFNAPRAADLTATIGDVLIANLSVDPQDRIGTNAADSLMLQQLRLVDDIWWPSTLFIRDVPGEMYLRAAPAEDFNVHEVTSFQGMFEMTYRSNSDDMDLFLETRGKAQNTRSSTLMLAENLPDVFVLEVTDAYGAHIAASGNGVEKLYIRRSDAPMNPFTTLVSSEIIGENLRNVDVEIKRVAGYPIIVLSGITGGRIVATAHAEITIGDTEIDTRGVLLDAQFTGGIPTASSMAVNGVVTDLSLIGGLTGDKVETTHLMIAEPFSSVIATVAAMVVG
jgi:hypothetical protein